MRKPLLRRALCLLVAFAALPGTAAVAGCAGAGQICQVPEGRYRIELPVGAAHPPAVIFLHGYGSSGAAMLRNPNVARPLLDRGYAVIAPDGRGRDGGNGGRWSFHPLWPKSRDERAFLRSVARDAVARHGVDAARIVLAGFSIGGSMVSYIACEAPDAFAAYAPVAGGFWRPHPQGCAGPVRLLHTHGWRDGVVPLEGRSLRGGAIRQGDVFHTMLLWRAANGCSAMRADGFQTGRVWRRRWGDCIPGSALELALHPGGHMVPEGWAAMLADWFEGLD